MPKVGVSVSITDTDNLSMCVGGHMNYPSYYLCTHVWYTVLPAAVMVGIACIFLLMESLIYCCKKCCKGAKQPAVQKDAALTEAAGTQAAAGSAPGGDAAAIAAPPGTTAAEVAAPRDAGAPEDAAAGNQVFKSAAAMRAAAKRAEPEHAARPAAPDRAADAV
jgi:hypothetical protein